MGNFDTKSDKEIFPIYSPSNRDFKAFNCKANVMVESINLVVDDVRNTSTTEPDIEENVNASSSSKIDNTSMTNDDENDKDQETTEEEQTSVVKKETHTTKNHPTNECLKNT